MTLRDRSRRAAPVPETAPAEVGMQPVETLGGISPALRGKLRTLGITRVLDLWFHLPLRYEDLTRLTALGALVPGEKTQAEGTVVAVERSFRFRPQLKVALADTSGALLTLRFLHFRAAQAERLAPGARVRCHGEVRFGSHGLEMIHPRYQVVAAGAALESALTPVYPAVEGVTQHRLRGLVARALQLLPPDAGLECLPETVRRRFGLGSLRSALQFVHRPPPDADTSALLQGRHPAQSRLAFEELLAHNLSLKRLRQAIRVRRAPLFAATGGRRAQLLARLPFALTAAQQRVLGELDHELGSGIPMLRLLQGDVGSGKTVVAALAVLAAVDAGWQAAVMAPTEVLAEQHYRNFSRWLEPLGVRVTWLAGKVKGGQRAGALAALAGDAEVAIGTHALMQEGVAFRRLGLAVIDEQHRFGVRQRLAMRDKGLRSEVVPHQLVMTATPIPRTLAMTNYADLDLSVIDELPPGRQPVQTVAIAASRRGEVIARIRHACAEGRQAYWVCTLIEESDQLEAQAAEAVATELAKALPELAVGLVHGRLKPREKQEAMAAFIEGRTRLLVATTVIEVGVDVANASLMVVENAERLGLSQLHQLRGRIGRGSAASTCVLLYLPPLSEQARERIAAMRETSDGFRIAELDLALRGPGEMLGTRQTGEARFRVADLVRDAELLPQVGAAADEVLETAPGAAAELIRRWVGAAERLAEA